MMMKKKGAVYSVIALMLCVAVYLNWSYNKGEGEGDYSSASDFEEGKLLGETKLVDGVDKNKDEQKPQADATQNQVGSNTAQAADYFSEARLSRQKARDEAVSILNVTIENENATEEAKSEANTSMKNLAECAVKEARIENLVVAKGYVDCVVFINDNGVNVIVKKPDEGIKDADVAKIKDIVIGEAEVTAEQIKIIETES